MTRLKPWPALLLLGLLSLSACGEHSSSGDGDALGQVVARVNGEEITISQLNAELASVSASGQDPKAVREEVLRAIVFRTLLRQAALKQKLDRKPDVHLLMDAARDKVLAESYMDTLAGANKEPSGQEIAKYVSDHPLAFGERRIYHFQRLMLAADKYSDDMRPLFDQKPQTQSFDQLEDNLKGQGIAFTLADVQLPSTDFPEQVQNRLLQFGVGDNVVVRGPQSIIILKIKGWTAMPVQQADAQRIAAAALRQEALSTRTAALRTQMIHDAKIAFTGEFAGMSANEPSDVPAANDSAPPASSGAAAPEQGSNLAAPDAEAPTTAAPSNTPDSQPSEGVVPAPSSGASDPQEGTAQ